MALFAVLNEFLSRDGHLSTESLDLGKNTIGYMEGWPDMDERSGYSCLGTQFVLAAWSALAAVAYRGLLSIATNK
jgi:hypothetical protein